MGTRAQDIASVTFNIGRPYFSSADTFSIPMLISSDVAGGTGAGNRVNSYNTLEDVLVDYAAGTDTYKWAAAFFGQTSKGTASKPNILKIGFKQATQNCKWTVAWNADASGGTFKIGVAGTESSTIAWNADAATIKTAIDGIAGVATVTVTLNGANASKKEGFTIEFTGDAGTDFPTVTANVTSLTGVTTATLVKTQVGHTPELYTTAYAAIKAADPAFFFAFILARLDLIADLDSLHTTFESEPRFLIVTSSNTNCLTSATSGNIIADLKTLAVKNTICFWHSATYATQFLDAAEFGAVIPDFFGSTNPAMYPLSLITGDTFTTAQIANLVAIFANRCETVYNATCIMGTSSANNGAEGLVCMDGMFAYKRWVKYFMEQRCSEDLVNLILIVKRLSGNTTDFNKIQSTLLNTMLTYEKTDQDNDQGLIEKGTSVVTMPTPTEWKAKAESLVGWLSSVSADGEMPLIINKITVSGTIA